MNAIQFPFQFDAQRIHGELLAISSAFQTIHSNKIEEERLQGMHLIRPSINGQKDDHGYTYQLSKELKQSPYLQSILDFFPCDKLQFRIHNLQAKGAISLHRDSDRGLTSGIVRIHIPVTTNPSIYFYVNGERILMQNGECWYADITQLHEVENRSDTDRLQLMIDCQLNDWWKNLLSEQGLDSSFYSKWNKHSLEELVTMKTEFAKNGILLEEAELQEMEMVIALKMEG